MAMIRFNQAWGTFTVDQVVDLPYPVAQVHVEVARRAEWVKKVKRKWVVSQNPTLAAEPECATVEPPEKAVKPSPRKRKATKGAGP